MPCCPMLADQIRAIDNRRFIKYVGQINDTTRRQLDENLTLILHEWPGFPDQLLPGYDPFVLNGEKFILILEKSRKIVIFFSPDLLFLFIYVNFFSIFQIKFDLAGPRMVCI